MTASKDITPGKWINKLEGLYGPHVVYGPYINQKMMPRRRFMILILPGGKRIHKQYAKFKLEVKLGRVLSRHETVNHRDTNSMNDEFYNLELLTLVDNIKHAHASGILVDAYEKTRQRMIGNKIIVGEKNPSAVFTEAEVIEYRKQAATKSGKILRAFRNTVSKKHGCGKRSVRNMLNGSTYPHLSGAIKGGKVGRPPNIL